MKKLLISMFFALGAADLPQTATAETTVSWQCSTAAAPWQDKGTLTFSPSDDGLTGHHVEVFESRKYQTFDGWGGCFNEKGWKAMAVLSDQDRATVMQALFDPQSGLRLTFGRTPIGASDYALSPYSLDDTPDDFDMAHFSIDRDKQLLIPYIKAALALQPGLKMWGVPWSPPGWMKDSNSLIGGKIKTDPKTMDAMALYFEKYVQAYQGEGIPLFMVMPQNEPVYTTKYPSCQWTGEQLAGFIKNYLGPKIAADSIKCEIWQGTLTNSDYSYILPVVDDEKTLSMIQGFGFQWSGDKACSMVNHEHQGKKLMQSETECGNHENDWHYAEKQYDLIRHYLEAGVESYMLWNMVLDETGKNTADWAQCSPVVVDGKTKQVTYTPQFYGFKHFSHYIEPGAVRVLSTGNVEDSVAFLNPNGDIVVVLRNAGAKDDAVAIKFHGQQVQPTLPAHSLSTLIFHHSS